MSYMVEYMKKNKDEDFEYENELSNLIECYNKKTGKYLLVYSVDFQNNDFPIGLFMDDFYTIRDFLREDESKKLSFLIETPGGQGEASEEIATYLRGKYEYIDFIIVGNCKSAGTMLALSGDEIYMNETGNLGPIDPQMCNDTISGSVYHFLEWINEKRKESKTKELNPVDSLIISRITPYEITGAFEALSYGENLVARFLKEYKFKNWKRTETNNIKVTDEMKKQKAMEIAKKLSDQSKWKSHGKPLKKEELRELGLKIKNLEDDKNISEIIERIHVLIRLIFSSSDAFKILITEDSSLIRKAIKKENINIPMDDEHLGFGMMCDKCGEESNIYFNLDDDPTFDEEMIEKGFTPVPDDSIIKCKCGNKMDISKIRSLVESQLGDLL
ncbi:SDH family Clp fold serine proteinase [Methanobrevibacter sp. DSM 116169]|uniref:SDH family Clp fold serine proteinase n=1 Tax=Methanobrevibacter sp. DSM 116169 TaxID=3242727 RepID=UPI0038FCB3A4